jgi:hypothetical protein
MSIIDFALLVACLWLSGFMVLFLGSILLLFLYTMDGRR